MARVNLSGRRHDLDKPLIELRDDAPGYERISAYLVRTLLGALVLASILAHLILLGLGVGFVALLILLVALVALRRR